MSDRMSKAKRPHRAREVVVHELSIGLYADAGDLLAEIVGESKGPASWRPARAAVQRILADAEGRTWMTAAEFTDWFAVQTMITKKRRLDIGPLEAAGIPVNAKLKIMRDTRPVSKIEALSMAHVAAGRSVPCEIGSPAAFDAWFTPRFGAVSAIAEFLELKDEYIGARLRGYDIALGVRRERAPEVTLLRALDWVWSVGPYCPTGHHHQPPAFPGQDLGS